jgi:lipid A 3-O-deacylase
MRAVRSAPRVEGVPLFHRDRLIGVVAAAMLGCGSAAAQTLSVDDPSYIALGAGIFDFLHDGTAGEFRGEFRSGYKLLGVLKPFAGASVTTDGGVYGYGGVGVDVYFGPHWVLTPNAAVGAFEEGGGKDLGSTVEFRTGAELAYRFDNRARLGLAFHHTSNAGITDRNPGAETLMLMYSMPLAPGR